MSQDEHPRAAAASCRLCSNRWVEGAAGLVGATVNELVPPDAQLHLWNAQRELLLALAATIEHHTNHLRSTPPAPPQSGRRPSRVTVD